MSKTINSKNNQGEVVLWSIALPGFGQLLNGKYFKGFILITLEIIVNVKGKINLVIMKSYLGEMEQAIMEADFLWLMFYPCLYLYAIWDAYRDASHHHKPYLYIPFVFSAYLGTIGVIYSTKIRVFNYLIGPVFLPIVCMIIGFVIGQMVRYIIIKRVNLSQ